LEQPGLGGPEDPVVPEDVKTATGYRELLVLLEQYAREGLSELRAVNPRRNGLGR
jgi:hypothetical protein